MRSLSEILHEYPQAAEGLTPDLVEQSRRTHGSNQLPAPPRLPLRQLFLAKFDESIIKILLAAALLSMLLELLNPPLAAYAAGLGFRVRPWGGSCSLLLPSTRAYSFHSCSALCRSPDPVAHRLGLRSCFVRWPGGDDCRDFGYGRGFLSNTRATANLRHSISQARASVQDSVVRKESKHCR